MRIGIDSRPLRDKQTSGIPAYVRNLLDRLAKLDSENEYVLYAHRDFNFNLPSQKWSKRFGAVTRYGTVWMQMELPYWLKRDKVDCFWGTQHTLPLLMPRRTKAILTVCDLVHCVFPDTMRWMNLLINKFIIPPSVHRTDVILGISQWTLNDVRRFLNPQNKVTKVISMGVGSQFYPRDKKASQKIVQSHYNILAPYILTVGTLEPRKNLRASLLAFSNVAERIPHHLVVVGQTGWKNESTLNEIRMSRYRNRIHLLGYVPDHQLPEMYSAADAFLFPSLYEGFGIPPLEAMASAIPVVASNVSSLPEVVGDAAILVDPNDSGKIAAGLIDILTNSSLRSKLIKKGLDRARLFTWDKAARGMMKIFEDVKKSL